MVTVSDHIRPRLRQEHPIGIDTRIYSSPPASPVDRDRVTLEQIGEEESYGPDVDDNNHGPNCVYHSTVGKDPINYFNSIRPMKIWKISPSIEEKHS